MQIATVQNNNLVQSHQDIESLVNSFLFDQDIKISSRSRYRRTLKQYFQYLEAYSLSLDVMQLSNLIEYKAFLFDKGLTSLTVSSYLTSLKKFYEWTESKKLYPNIAKGLKAPKRINSFKKQPLQPEQAKQLINGLKGGSLRDQAIISLLLRTGLRTIEVNRANVGDLTDKGGRRVLMIHGKGRDTKDNFVLITDKTYLDLKAYLGTRTNLDPSQPLFISGSNNSKGQSLDVRTISKIAKNALKSIGLDSSSYTAHSLRHTAATAILRSTGDLEQTRLFCRHANPATTLIYTHTLTEERRIKNSGEDVLDSIY